MNRYIATFTAGVYDIIVKHLKSLTMQQFTIDEHDTSSVIFQSSLPIERLIELRYFTNIYKILETSSPSIRPLLRGQYYSLALLKDGKPQALKQNERDQLETNIQRWYHLKPHTHLSRNNFYVIERSSGKKVFTLRLPKAKFKRESIPAGELRPELAHILCLVAGVKAKQVLVDTCAGYGGIPYEAIRGFGCTSVIAIDTHIKSNRRQHPSIQWHHADARHLDFLAPASIDRVVTDPPWGIYEKVDDEELFYRQLLQEIRRILRPDGIGVLLSGSPTLDDAIQTSEGFVLVKQYPVLVSGKKATIHKLQKQNERSQ